MTRNSCSRDGFLGGLAEWHDSPRKWEGNRIAEYYPLVFENPFFKVNFIIQAVFGG